MTTHAIKLVTAEELFEMGDIGRCELVNGEIIKMAPAGSEHGEIAAEITTQIKNFVKSNHLGKVYAAETGFTISRNPDTVRAPDVAFVGKDRASIGKRRGYFDGVPDLAVEVVSPDDRPSKLKAKVQQWLTAGTTSVWVVDPTSRSIDMYRGDAPVKTYRVGDEIRDEPTLPGFILKVEEIFEAD